MESIREQSPGTPGSQVCNTESETVGNFIFRRTGFEGLMLIKAAQYADKRGYFAETYHEKNFATAGLDRHFVQDNLALSRKGVLRGLHYQIKHPQGKLIRVVSGAAFDVAVDMREGSPTFGKWFGETLTAENCIQIFVPEGFAHGYLALSDSTVIQYKCTRFYDQSDEGGIAWNDPVLGIAWPALDTQYILGNKDRDNPLFSERKR